MPKRLTVVVALLALAASLAASPAGSQEVPETQPADLRQAPFAFADVRPAAVAEASLEPGPDGRVHVEVAHHGSDAEVQDLFEAAGGSVAGIVPGALVEGDLPAGAVDDLSASPLVDDVRTPLAVNEPASTAGAEGGPTVGEEVDLTDADAWHDLGVTGTGVQVGILDNFGATNWATAEAAGEVPTPAGTFCRSGGATCELFAAEDLPHGVAVAEVVHEMAPDAELFLADVRTTSDLQAAVEWFDQQGVDVISRGAISPYDGNGRGSGPIDDIVRAAIVDGMTWIQAVGDLAGQEDVRLGSYHRWTFRDADGDHWVEFAPGDEILEFWCGEQLGLRWDDSFPGVAGNSDYDLLVFDPATIDDPNPEPIAVSARTQVNGHAPPLERTTTCVPGWNYALVGQYSAGTSSVGDVLEFGMADAPLGRWRNQYSATVPAADITGPGVLAVGAIDPADGTTVANYSSRGPTNDFSTISPGISAPACVTTTVYGDGCFDGTAASAAATAGAAALVIDAGYATAPRRVTAFLTGQLAVDRGAPFPDNLYGTGQLIFRTQFPDLLARVGRTGPFRGDGIMNPSGASQGATAESTLGSTRTFTVRLQNDGLVPDSYRLQGGPSQGRFLVDYFFGGVRRTRQVIDGTLVTPELQPGEFVDLIVTVKTRRTPAGPRYTHRRVFATSISNPDRGRDAIQVNVNGPY